MTPMHRAHVAAGLLAAAVAVFPSARASERLPNKPFIYDAKQTQLTDVLRDFAGAIGVPIVIADGVSATVNSKFQLAPHAFLELISRSFALIWYYDGTALHIYPSNQIESRLYRLNRSQAKDVEERLKAFRLLDGRYPVRVTGSDALTLVFVSGPPRHIQLIDALLDATGSDAVEPVPETIRAFQLVHASAVDRTIQGVSVPGVASVLGSFYGVPPIGRGASSGADAAGTASLVSGVTQGTESMVASAATLMGTPDSRARRDQAIRSTANALKGGGTPPLPGSTGNTSSSFQVVTPATPEKPKPGRLSFMADEATNIVLVRASAGQMPEIEALIAKLDVAREMVQVEATIIDISSDEVESLGFEWRLNNNAAVRELDLAPAIGTTTTSGAIPQGGGFNITTLLASGGWELLARVRALEARGTARVVSQPKVLGAANRTAVLSDKRTASVRVAGNQDARLYSVETGTELRVTPRVIEQPGAMTRIGMEVLIEDGGFASQAVDDVPIAQRTFISTIAVLNEGQALLVGGIEVEGSGQGRSAIPLLSKLPVVGALFRFDSQQGSRRQRLFLIKPKRVNLDAVGASLTAPSSVVRDRPADLHDQQR